MSWQRQAVKAERAASAQEKRLWNDAAERWSELATEARGTPEAEVAAARARKARKKAATSRSRQRQAEKARRRRADHWPGRPNLKGPK